MNILNVQASIADAQEALLRASAALQPDPVALTTHVLAGQSLQAALNLRLPITTEPNVTFPGSYTYPSDTNIVFGAGSGIKGTTGSAVYIAPGTHNVKANGVYESGHPQLIQIGEDSDNQKDVADQPTDIAFAFCRTNHIGKRAFEVHASRVSITDCVGVVTNPNQDSQFVYVGNADRGGLIARNHMSAGSEVVLFGGASTTRLTPKDWIIEDNEITRPREWQTDGQTHRVKNLFEAKNLVGFVLRRNRLSNNWRDTNGGQSGFAILLTPATDGSKPTQPAVSGTVGNGLIEDNDIFDVSCGFQMTGRSSTSMTPDALFGIVIRNNRIRISRTLFNDGAFGQFIAMSGGVASLDIEDNTILSDGSSFIYAYQGSVLPMGSTTYTTQLAEKTGHLGFQRNRVGNLGSYGFNMWGVANAKEVAWQAAVADYALSGNVYNGQARTGYLGGTFLAGAEFDALPDVMRTKALGPVQ